MHIVSSPMLTPSPACMADGQEHAQITVGYDSQRDEEYKAAQHQSVTFIGWSRRHIVPRARGHQALGNVRASREIYATVK